MSKLAHLIKDKRKNAGLSLKQLGEQCGVSDAAIQRIESDKNKKLNWNILFNVAIVLNIPILDILKQSDYIKDLDFNKNNKLYGLENFDDDDLSEVQHFINYMIYKKQNINKNKD